MARYVHIYNLVGNMAVIIELPHNHHFLLNRLFLMHIANSLYDNLVRAILLELRVLDKTRKLVSYTYNNIK